MYVKHHCLTKEYVATKTDQNVYHFNIKLFIIFLTLSNSGIFQEAIVCNDPFIEDRANIKVTPSNELRFQGVQSHAVLWTN